MQLDAVIFPETMPGRGRAKVIGQIEGLIIFFFRENNGRFDHQSL